MTTENRDEDGTNAIPGPHLERAVARYLRDCADYSSTLDPGYHPTENGAIKVIFARNKAEKGAIREAFRRIRAAK